MFSFNDLIAAHTQLNGTPPPTQGKNEMNKYVAAALAGLTCIAPTAANASGIALEANGARAHAVWGGEVGVGYNLTLGGFTLRPIAGAFIYRGDSDRYYMDSFSNGQERCRDVNTVQFANDAKCDNTAVMPYGKVEATYSFASVEVGGGARFSSEKVRPYGTIGMTVSPKVKLKGNVGDRYYALGIRADF